MVKVSKPSYICPVCSSKNNKYFLNASHSHGGTALERKEFEYFQCQRCNALFLVKTKFNKEYYNKYYNFDGYYQDRMGVKKVIEDFLDKNSQINKNKIISSAVKRRNKKVKILDVGAGEGKFLASLNASVFDKYGIELDKKSYERCKNKGLTVYNEDILKKDFKNKRFDIITLWHVIEHITTPPILMKKLHALLADGGRIIISTPNIESLGFRVAKEHWFHMDAPRHVVLFGEEAIRILSKDNGLVVETVQSEKFEFPLDLYWSFKNAKKLSFVSPIGPILKHFDRETLTYVIKKSHTF